MPVIGEDVASIGSIPDLYRLITAPRGDAPVIGRPRHREHSIRMPVIGEDVASIGSIPDLHRLIATSRGDAPAIGRPRHRIHRIEMPRIDVKRLSYSGRSGRGRRRSET